TEREPLALPRLEQEVVEPVERRLRIVDRMREPGVWIVSDAHVVADDAGPLALRPMDALTRPFREVAEDGVLVDALEDQRDLVARRLDLVDRVEPGPIEDRAVPDVVGRDLRIDRHHIDALGLEVP